MTAPLRIYAIGDVHGQLELLRRVHADVAEDLAARPAAHVVLHIGDYVDRGPDSRGVLDHLVAREAAGAGDVNLLGNHDRMFRSYLEGPVGDDARARDERLREDLWWLHERLGGTDTLRSYGLSLPDGATEARGERLRDAALAAVPETHLAFLKGLRTSWRSGGWFFAHAGVRPGVPLDAQDEDDLVWIREPFLDSRADHGAVVVHGHTPVDRVEDHGVRIAIDTGAAFGGPLSCVVLEGAGARLLGGAVFR